MYFNLTQCYVNYILIKLGKKLSQPIRLMSELNGFGIDKTIQFVVNSDFNRDDNPDLRTLNMFRDPIKTVHILK